MKYRASQKVIGRQFLAESSRIQNQEAQLLTRKEKDVTFPFPRKTMETLSDFFHAHH